MEENKTPNQQSTDDTNSLETADDAQPNLAEEAAAQKKEKKVSLPKRVAEKLRGLNIYFMIFVFLVFLAAMVTLISYSSSKKPNTDTIDGQTLSEEDLANLSSENSTVGDPKSTLTVASNAIFNGRVLIRDSIDVAGTIRVGGSLSLPGITVSGTSAFEDVQVGNNLSIGGNTAINGQLTVQQGLTLGGNATISGSLSAASIIVDSLQLNSDLQITKHIDTGGGRPGISVGSAGNGGTVSISGSDTAGTITINVGGGAPAGVMANITFAVPFNDTPYIVISPVGSSAAQLQYYITKTSSGFSIATVNAPPSIGAYVFDYVAFN